MPATDLHLFKNSHCPMCATAFQDNVVATVRECEYDTTDQEFHFHQCPTCETLALDPRPSREDFEKIYPSNYYSFHGTLNQTGRKIEWRAFVQGLFFRIWKKDIQRYVVKHAPLSENRPIRILDIGCGVGAKLDVLKFIFPSAETWGIEIGEDVVRCAADRGHKILKGFFEDIDIPKDYFDVIIGVHVLEHVSEPDRFIQKAASLLSRNGVLTLATPNTDSWDFKLFKSRHWGGYHAPRHWYLFNQRSFKALSNRMDIEIVDWAPYSLSSFWVTSLHSVTRDLLGERIAGVLFPPVKVLQGGPYSFLLLGFFTVIGRSLLFLTGKGNAMWITLKRKKS